MACVVARREAGLTTLEPKGGLANPLQRVADAPRLFSWQNLECSTAGCMSWLFLAHPGRARTTAPSQSTSTLCCGRCRKCDTHGGSQLKRGSSSHHRGLEPLCLSDRRLRPASMRARQLMHTRKVCSLALRPGHVAKRCSVFPAEERKNLLLESRVCVPGSIVTPPSSDSSESCRTGRWPIRASWDFRGATKHHVTKLATAAEVAATAKRSHRSTSMAHGRAKMLG